MRFLLSTWHFRVTDSFECFTMAMDFLCQNVGKVDLGSFKKKKKKMACSFRLEFTSLALSDLPQHCREGSG